MFDNKAQSALEYLMTYGWALIVIAIVIGVLIFVTGGATGGVQCQSSSTGFVVKEAPIATGAGGVKLSVQNTTGGSIAVNSISTDGTVFTGSATAANLSSKITTDYNSVTGLLVKNGTVLIQGGTLAGPATAGTFQNGSITIDYNTQGGLTSTAKISCSGSLS